MPLPPDTLRTFALTHTRDLIARIDPSGRFVWRNAAWRARRPFPDGDIDHLFAYLHRDDQAILRDRLATGEQVPPVRVRAPSDGWVPVQFQVAPCEGGFDVLGTTSPVVADQALRDRLDQLELAHELAEMGHWRVLLDRGRLVWSDHMFHLVRRDPLQGADTLENSLDRHHPDDREATAAKVAAALERREGYAVEGRVRRDDGEWRVFRSVGRPRVVDDEVVEVFGVTHDVTEQRAAEHRLRHSERLATLGTLSAGLAHEINNPLSYVLLNIQALEEDLADLRRRGLITDLGVELAADIHDGARRIQQIVRSLKSFAKTRDGVAFQPVDLRTVVAAAHRLVAASLQTRAKVSVREPDRPVEVLGDEGQLAQVVTNLLLNAAQAMPEGRLALDNHIEVVLEVAEGQAELSVRDNGSGMTPATLEKATRPFFTTRGSDQGSGLGLYIVRNLLEAHGGELRIDSELGRGTTMHVSLPLASPSTAKGTEAEPEPGKTAATTILLIDDDPRVARSVAHSMRPHAVHIETDPAKALHLLENQGGRFRLVVCDLVMPGLTGAQLYERLPAEVQARMVFLTGGAATPGCEAFAESMGERVLIKPPSRATLQRLAASAAAGQPDFSILSDP